MKKIFLSAIFFLFFQNVFCQNVLLKYNGSGSYVYIERTDVRRYDNGKYTGLVSREVRSFIAPTSVPSGGKISDRYYDGSFFIDEATKRNSREVNLGINGAVPSSFKISSDGILTMLVDNGYPSFRSFPAFTNQRISIGDKWQAKAERVVDPLNKGIFTKLPILVEYTYLKDELFHGEEVYVFSAQWATRYGISYWDFAGDKDLKSAQGSHKATMYVSKKSGNALVVRDMVDETFIYNDGNIYSFKGSISMFTEYPPAYDKNKLIPALQRVASVSEKEIKEILEKPVNESSWIESEKKSSGSIEKNDFESGANSRRNNSYAEKKIAKNENQTYGAKNHPQKKKDSADEIQSKISAGKNSSSNSKSEKKVIVENTAAGIRLTMQNLNFKPDSAELLPGENERLDQITQVLKEVPDQMFLVEGHTASVGYEKGEMKLSVERANSVANALIQRGIPREKFICKGSGGTKPIADNSTQEGKAKNRRVEITILE
ncbi:MAG: OmpA family protein [Treponema succinifaciens]|uniref:OmpA family protein n=1 Tax=Treponema TaxID=157 RepID=UPI0023F4D6FB|nr:MULTISPECIES: OmpA family protein [Treponema]MDD6961458.1 OmpA family protein [Treponema succinifaciens]MDY5116417.1 OmpA family protein [Treponema succinifaciens]